MDVGIGGGGGQQVCREGVSWSVCVWEDTWLGRMEGWKDGRMDGLKVEFIYFFFSVALYLNGPEYAAPSVCFFFLL